MTEIHHVEPTLPIVTSAQWRRVFIDGGIATVRATGRSVSSDDEVLVLLQAQPSAADNGPWLVKSDGSHRRPHPEGSPS